MKKIILIISLFITFSCTNKSDNINIGGDISLADSVRLENPTIMKVDSIVLSEISGIYLIDNRWFFAEYLDRTVHCYDINGDSIIHQSLFAQQGRGPLDLVGSCMFNKIGDNSVFYGLSGPKGRGFILNDINAETIKNPGKWECIDLSNMGTSYIAEITPLSNNKFAYVTLGNFKSNLFTYTLGDSAKCMPRPYPDYESTRNMSDEDKTMQFIGYIFRHPSKDKIIYTAANWLNIFVADIENDSLKNIHYLYNNELSLDKDTPSGYREGTLKSVPRLHATEKYIYVPMNYYSHDMWMDLEKHTIDGYPHWYTKEIHVFDWEGNIVKMLLFDNYFSRGGFIVDSNDEYLYARTIDLQNDDKPYMMRYKIK